MSYRGQRGSGRYDADPWLGGNGWGGQQMWQGTGHHSQGAYGHHQAYGGNQGAHGGGYYSAGPPQTMRGQLPRHNYQQANRGYNRPPQQHQGQNRGIKRNVPQNFNNGVTVVKRMRGGRGRDQHNKAGAAAGGKKEAKDECVVLDDSEKKSQEGFCKICQEKFDGTYNQHKLTKPHREKRAQKYPSCGPCGLKFNGDDARQRYEVHLGSKAHMQVVETAELDIKEGQEPEGMELCEPIEAVLCSLCECVFKKDLIDTHCKTKGHLKRITKKKAEAERAAKKAETDAKKAAGEDTGEADEEKDNEENGDEGDEEDHADEEDVEDDGDDDVQDEAAAGNDAAAKEATPAQKEPEPVAESPKPEPVVEKEPEPEPAEPEPVPEPVKATPRKATARRGRGRGKK